MKKTCVVVSLTMVAVFATVAPAATKYWDVSTATGYQGGSGTWKVSNTAPYNTYWSTNGTTASYPNGGNDDAIFRSELTGTGYTVYIGDDGVVSSINTKSLTVSAPGYTFTNSSAYTGTTPTASSLRTAGGAITINTTATFDVNLTQYTGTANLIMGGSASDVLRLKQSNAYTGTTAINSGTVKLDGVGAFHNSSSIFIATGAYLDASTITNAWGNSYMVGATSTQSLKGSGAVTGKMKVTNTGTVSPGDTLTTSNLIGTLSVTSDLTLQSGSKYNVDVASNLTSDCLSTGGDLALGGSLLNLSGTWAAPSGGHYTILSYGGTRTGTFATVTGMDPSWSIQYNDAAKEVWLVPEPTTIAILAVGGICMLRRKRALR